MSVLVINIIIYLKALAIAGIVATLSVIGKCQYKIAIVAIAR
ncbi:hypothetical protein [Rhizobium leguminosarum]|nr:hypothetical protein [Rhizobium leguminosarum]